MSRDILRRTQALRCASGMQFDANFDRRRRFAVRRSLVLTSTEVVLHEFGAQGFEFVELTMDGGFGDVNLTDEVGELVLQVEGWNRDFPLFQVIKFNIIRGNSTNFA